MYCSYRVSILSARLVANNISMNKNIQSWPQLRPNHNADNTSSSWKKSLWYSPNRYQLCPSDLGTTRTHTQGPYCMIECQRPVMPKDLHAPQFLPRARTIWILQNDQMRVSINKSTILSFLPYCNCCPRINVSYLCHKTMLHQRPGWHKNTRWPFWQPPVFTDPFNIQATLSTPRTMPSRGAWKRTRANLTFLTQWSCMVAFIWCRWGQTSSFSQ